MCALIAFPKEVKLVRKKNKSTWLWESCETSDTQSVYPEESGQEKTFCKIFFFLYVVTKDNLD